MADDVVIEEAPTALVRRTPRDVVLMPVMDIALAKRRMEELQEFCAGYLQESGDGGTDGGDYGVIPGAGKKKVLLKSGADKLCDVYGLADRYRILAKVEDFDRGLFDYTIQCELVRKTDEMFVGSGLGSCSSYESKYRWRESRRKCPECGKESIIKGKAEYGGGWLCWKKSDGCGAKFADADPAIVAQAVGRVENPDIMDTKNTVLKMAKKRAKIDAVIGVTRSSGIFTQDLEEHLADHGDAPPVEHAPQTAPAPATSHGVPNGETRQAGESQADYVARVKAEAAAKFAKPAGEAPLPTESKPAPAPAPVAAQALPVAPDGKVFITGINVRNGPMVMKDGMSQPQWGPLFIIAFGAKVKASDGVMVSDATTFDQALAQAAEQARDTQKPLMPKVSPGKKKGSYVLAELAG